jgi:hypothetical protein
MTNGSERQTCHGSGDHIEEIRKTLTIIRKLADSTPVATHGSSVALLQQGLKAESTCQSVDAEQISELLGLL